MFPTVSCFGSRAFLPLILAFLAAPALAARPAPASPAIQQIELFQRLPSARAESLRGLVERFNAQSKGAKIVLVERDWRARDVPHLLILDDAEEDDFLSGKQRFKPLHALMKEAGVALQTLRPPAVMERRLLDGKSRLLALPVGLSTPVLYFNRNALRLAGLDVETVPMATWAQLQDVLGHLARDGSACPYTVAEPGRVMVENLSAWHNQPLSVFQGKKHWASFNGMLQVKHIAQMASWVRARYLHVFAERAEAEQRFARGECAVIVAPSDSWVDFRRQPGIDVAVARLPYDGDFAGAPQNTLADGPALWVAAGKKGAEYKAIASFVRFWLQAEVQVAWQRETGYLPLNRAGLLAAQSELLGADLANIQIAVEQLTARPVTRHSAATPLAGNGRLRRILDEELAQVWIDSKAAKAALDNAVARVSADK
jgi:sn-glycerol 3-phosphate transport system substrate-binding protein